MIKVKKHFCTESLRNVETTDVASSTLWIVAFFISLIINIIFISTTLISRRYGMKYLLLFSAIPTGKQLLFIFWFWFQTVIMWSSHLDIYLFLIGKHSWNRSLKRIRLIFLVDLGLSQYRQLQLVTLLTIKISMYHKAKTLIKHYINSDSNWRNRCHQ